MSDVTRLLSAIDAGDQQAAELLLPLVYAELRKLAAAKLAHEKPGQTLQATALVHEAYLRLVAPAASGGLSDASQKRDSASGGRKPPDDAHQSTNSASTPDPRHPTPDSPLWAGRAHFFAAAAEAMRRILVEQARRKARERHGGKLHRVELPEAVLATPMPPEELLALDEALAQLTAEDALKGKLVELRFFAGMTNEEAAQILGITAITAKRYWRYARAWLRQKITGDAACMDEGVSADQNFSRST